MMINKDLRLRRVDNKNFVVAVGEKSKSFQNMITLNDTAAFVFEKLYSGEKDVAQLLVKEYDVSLEKARADVDTIIKAFEKAGFFL